MRFCGAVTWRGVLPAGLKHLRHLLVNQIDCLHRPQHDFELSYLSGVVPLDHVDTIDGDAVEYHLKLEYGVSIALEFTNVAKRLVEKNVESGSEVLLGDGLSHLGRMHHRRVEDGFVGKQRIESPRIAILDEVVPHFDRAG